MLGAVREIHTFDMTVSLPYNMVGVVSCNDISDPLVELMKKEVGDSCGQEEEVSWQGRYLVLCVHFTNNGLVLLENTFCIGTCM